jgi:uncharacterized protein YceK
MKRIILLFIFCLYVSGCTWIADHTPIPSDTQMATISNVASTSASNAITNALPNVPKPVGDAASTTGGAATVMLVWGLKELLVWFKNKYGTKKVVV